MIYDTIRFSNLDFGKVATSKIPELINRLKYLHSKTDNFFMRLNKIESNGSGYIKCMLLKTSEILVTSPYSILCVKNKPMTKKELTLVFRRMSGHSLSLTTASTQSIYH